MSTIKNVHAIEILDSRGNPTVHCTVTLKNGVTGSAQVPSGASTGIHEAHELRDGGDRFHGKGVSKAVKNVNSKINKIISGMNPKQQRKIDTMMIESDGTKDKSKLGANAILSVSLATAVAAAKDSKKELYEYLSKLANVKPSKKPHFPLPMMNIVNGGQHASNGLDIQEFMIIPHQKNIRDRIRCGAEVFQTLKKLLHDKGLPTMVGDEGGFAPEFKNHRDVLETLKIAIQKTGYKPGTDITFAMDIAASEFYKNGAYTVEGKKMNSEEFIEWQKTLISGMPITSIEDNLDQDDWDAWQTLTKKFGKKMQLVGDDLFVTNTELLQKGINMNVANAILIKFNQIGSLTETLDAIALARKHDYNIVISHRSGDTCDTFIADLAVAMNAEYIKTGSLSRAERVAKYNRLLEIADHAS